MIALTWDEIAGLDLGEIRGTPPPDGLVRRVHADSRDARPGDVFVALNTGVRYVDDAVDRGAAALLPHDQHAALAALAGLVRARSDAHVVAVVGSAGKTSTKDALGALCAAVTPTVFADASQNNEIGLPLTVLRLEPQTRVLVTEMGMRGLGQIAELCSIARPDVALVTSVGPEHLELVGTVEDAARANAEAIDALPSGGVAVVPAAEPLLEPYLRRDDVDVRRFDADTVIRVGANDADPALQQTVARLGRSSGLGARWRFCVGGRIVELELPFDQRHMAVNVLAALTAYDALGLSLDRAQEGARQITLSPWRGDVRDLPGGGVVVNDAYNANPTSMRAALEDLVARAQGRRRVAILGSMAELGAESGRYHDEVRELLRAHAIEVVIAVGDDARAYLAAASEERWIPDASDFGVAADVLRPGDVILVKASRAVGLEGIAAEIENIARAW